MKTFLLLLLLFINTPGPSTTVYICKGAKGKRYHLRADCRGLSNCQHKIVKMTLEDAQKNGFTLCGWEK
ncbi:hypothetical protein HDF24_25210 [Mucilaginibacter sp. X4EP1]|jgi:hypothetical protein|uniref:hypothetical protein n=1 Tax=Mucilaginibacter sp. X4EP1 TaxID=2723092 RepID=UPI00216969C8|nr:hypothetical protein [Mucilaginibacter sp. X4EP1]MCS3815089.1 hypothetical protein [Mucilaginibacter sp. X4EP1]